MSQRVAKGVLLIGAFSLATLLAGSAFGQRPTPGSGAGPTNRNGPGASSLERGDPTIEIDIYVKGADGGPFAQADQSPGKARRVGVVAAGAQRKIFHDRGRVAEHAAVGHRAPVRLDRRFPVLLCAGMLEFVPDPVAVLANAARHAEAGARFVLLLPRSDLMGRLYRQFHRTHGLNIRLFERGWIETAAPRSGWHVDRIVRVFPLSFGVRLHRI